MLFKIKFAVVNLLNLKFKKILEKIEPPFLAVLFLFIIYDSEAAKYIVSLYFTIIIKIGPYPVF